MFRVLSASSVILDSIGVLPIRNCRFRIGDTITPGRVVDFDLIQNLVLYKKPLLLRL